MFSRQCNSSLWTFFRSGQRGFRTGRSARANAAASLGSSEEPSMTKSLRKKPSQLAETIDLSKISERDYASSIIHGRSLYQPYYHPKTHGIPVALIHFRSHHLKLLDLATHFSAHVASALAIPCSKTVYLPTQRTLWTVIRGPFAHKKSQENFDRKVHKRCIKAWDADMEVVDRWIQYLQLHPVPGVGMRIIRWYRAPLGIGREHEITKEMEKEHMPDSAKVEEVAKLIIERETAAAEKAAAENAQGAVTLAQSSTPTEDKQS